MIATQRLGRNISLGEPFVALLHLLQRSARTYGRILCSADAMLVHGHLTVPNVAVQYIIHRRHVLCGWLGVAILRDSELLFLNLGACTSHGVGRGAENSVT